MPPSAQRTRFRIRQQRHPTVYTSGQRRRRSDWRTACTSNSRICPSSGGRVDTGVAGAAPADDAGRQWWPFRSEARVTALRRITSSTLEVLRPMMRTDGSVVVRQDGGTRHINGLMRPEHHNGAWANQARVVLVQAGFHPRPIFFNLVLPSTMLSPWASETGSAFL